MICIFNGFVNTTVKTGNMEAQHLNEAETKRYEKKANHGSNLGKERTDMNGMRTFDPMHVVLQFKFCSFYSPTKTTYHAKHVS